MGTIADILEYKGKKVHTISPDSTVFEAVQHMVDHNVGALLVMDADRLAGIITERDYLRQVVVKGRSSKDIKVKEIMSPHLVYVDPATDTEESMAVMSEKHIRHLPVMEHGELVGIVSIGDVVKQLSRDREAHIKYLTDYIADRYPG